MDRQRSHREIPTYAPNDLRQADLDPWGDEIRQSLLREPVEPGRVRREPLGYPEPAVGDQEGVGRDPDIGICAVVAQRG